MSRGGGLLKAVFVAKLRMTNKMYGEAVGKEGGDELKNVFYEECILSIFIIP